MYLHHGVYKWILLIALVYEADYIFAQWQQEFFLKKSREDKLQCKSGSKNVIHIFL